MKRKTKGVKAESFLAQDSLVQEVKSITDEKTGKISYERLIDGKWLKTTKEKIHGLQQEGYLVKWNRESRPITIEDLR